MQQRPSGPQNDEIHILFCFQKHSVQLATAPTPRPGSCSGICAGGEAVTSPGSGWCSERKEMQTCSGQGAQAPALAAVAAPASAPWCYSEMHTAGDMGYSGNARKRLWGVQSLGIDARQSQVSKSAWRNTSDALCSTGLQRSRVLQQGCGLWQDHAGIARYWGLGAPQDEGLRMLQNMALWFPRARPPLEGRQAL